MTLRLFGFIAFLAIWGNGCVTEYDYECSYDGTVLPAPHGMTDQELEVWQWTKNVFERFEELPADVDETASRRAWIESSVDEVEEACKPGAKGCHIFCRDLNLGAVYWSALEWLVHECLHVIENTGHDDAGNGHAGPWWHVMKAVHFYGLERLMAEPELLDDYAERVND